MNFTVIKKKMVIKSLCVALCFALLLPLLKISSAAQVFFGASSRKLPIYSVQTQEKKIAISFDCAWGTDYTDRLLEVMESEKVTCTFFCVEFWAKKYPEYLKKISEKGHEIGTHSATHQYMSKLTAEEIEKELASSSSAIESVTGTKPELFRPPYGDYDDLLIETAERAGYYVIQWSIDSLDWKNISANEITERVCSHAENGAIVLFHNQGLHTAEALPAIIKELKAKGFEFCTIGDLIYRENYEMNPDGSQKPINV